MLQVFERTPRHIADKITNKRIEVGGLTAKCISSNIRRPNILWSDMRCIPGIGREGNLVLVEALTSSGFRTEIEGQSGSNERIYKGDRFIAVLANRHSGTSESGVIPSEGIYIDNKTELDLLAAGAIVGLKTGTPGRNSLEPLRLRTHGLIAQDGKHIDLIELSGGHHELLNPSSPIIMVCGTSAEVGKTTTSSGLIQALKGEGLQVAGTKIAGTGRMRDILSLRDAGARPWLDFADVGLATTYTDPGKYTRAMNTLFNYVNTGEPDIIIAEAGGDPIEANIPTFLQNRVLMQYVETFVIVAGDVMGMMGTVAYLRQFAPNVPIFLTNPKGRNPYTTRERVACVLPGLPIFDSLNPVEVQGIAKQILKR